MVYIIIIMCWENLCDVPVSIVGKDPSVFSVLKFHYYIAWSIPVIEYLLIDCKISIFFLPNMLIYFTSYIILQLLLVWVCLDVIQLYYIHSAL